MFQYKAIKSTSIQEYTHIRDGKCVLLKKNKLSLKKKLHACGLCHVRRNWRNLEEPLSSPGGIELRSTGLAASVSTQ